jgi:signal peptidase I
MVTQQSPVRPPGRRSKLGPRHRAALRLERLERFERLDAPPGPALRLPLPVDAGTLRQAAFLIICMLSISLFVKSFVAQLYSVPSASMEPTLLVGDKIVVSRPFTQWHSAHRGDIVVFRDPGGWLPPAPAMDSAPAVFFEFIGLIPYNSGKHLVKRVVGEAGDVIECRGSGPLYRNGRPVLEPYIAPGAQPCGSGVFKVVVPARSVWVMGDNRDDSADSRYHLNDVRRGSVPLSLIVGSVAATVWPPPHWNAE